MAAEWQMDGQQGTCWQDVHAMILPTFIRAVYVHWHGDGCSLGWGFAVWAMSSSCSVTQCAWS